MSKKYTQELNPLVFEAVDKLVNFISPTFGPAQNKIIIQKGLHQDVLDDGVETARHFELPDEFENAVVKLVKEVAQKTNDRVGDGTTSSLIILQALMNEIRDDKRTSREIIKELEMGLIEFKEQLLAKSKQITTEEELQKVAYISFNNEKIAKVIAHIFWELGLEGVVTIEESRSMETTHNVVKGLQFPRGFASSYFINNIDRAETVMENPYILVTDRELYDVKELMPLLNKIISSGNRQLLIIADDIRGEALATLIINTLKGQAFLVAVRAPYYSNDKYEFLMDIAAVTGSSFLATDLGKKLEDMQLEDLGTADRVVITKDSTTIVGGKGKEIDDYVKKMKAMIETTESDLKRDKMRERLAKLTSGVAVIKVGGATENEMKALRYKVEDAVNATRVAFKEGVVRGAGITLAETHTSSPILNKALKYPHKQLLANMEVDEIEISEDIIDPVAVLIAGVESAISIVSLLITTRGILVEKNENIENKSS